MKTKHYSTIAIFVGCLLLASYAGANSLDVNGSAAMGPASSAFGLEVTLDDMSGTAFTPAWVMADETKGFDDETTLKGSFFINTQGITMPATLGANHFQSIILMEGFGQQRLVRLIFFVHRENQNGNWHLTAWHRDDNIDNWDFSGTGWMGFYNDANFSDWLIEFEWTAGNPGSLVVYRTNWTGGAPQSREQLMNVSLSGTANHKVNKVFAGVFAGQWVGTSGKLLLDEFVFTR